MALFAPQSRTLAHVQSVYSQINAGNTDYSPPEKGSALCGTSTLGRNGRRYLASEWGARGCDEHDQMASLRAWTLCPREVDAAEIYADRY
jgi:hypothetical protein